jgi:hypothetical protein
MVQGSEGTVTVRRADTPLTERIGSVRLHCKFIYKFSKCLYYSLPIGDPCLF